MQPHLVRWERTYGGQGLTILYVADAGSETAYLLSFLSPGTAADPCPRAPVHP